MVFYDLASEVTRRHFPTTYLLSLCARFGGEGKWTPSLGVSVAKFRKSAWDQKYRFGQFGEVQFAPCMFL